MTLIINIIIYIFIIREMKCRVHKVRMTHYSFENNSLGGLKHLKTL